MAVIIDWNDKVILRCKNTIIDALREEIENVIRENKIKLNEKLTELMEDLDQAGYGIGSNLAEYLHTKDDILIFIELTRRGIDKHYHEIPNLPQGTKDLLENFYKELIKISESFSDPV